MYVPTGIDQGAYFDGTDIIRIPSLLGSTFDYGNNHTISFWSYGEFGLFFKNSRGNTGFGITTSGGKYGDVSSMYLPLPGNASGNYYGDEVGVDVFFGIDVSGFNHFVIVKDSNTSIKIFKNGVYEKDVVKDFDGSGNINENVIGVGGTLYNTYPDMRFSGSYIDQIRIFDRVLDATEIGLLYQEGIR